MDFILRATNGILKKHFNTDFNDQNITIFDPFTGTGSFIARLLSKENALISDEALKEKFQKNLFAFDIVLLSYYIALINITQAAQNRDSSLKNFKNIALTDSLDYLEEKTNKGVFPFFYDLKENKDIKDTLAGQNIRVIIGNPPYSAGAKSENDNNQNFSHPKLEKLVYEKYGKNSTSRSVGATTRDTLIQSIRMASDLLKDKGVVGFVVNGSFIDSKSADGFRKCVAKEFSHLYVLNNSNGVATSRDPWVYNFSPNILTQSVQKCIDTYNADLKHFNARFREAFKQRTAKDKGIKPADRYRHLNDKEITTDKTKIAWTRGLKQGFIKNENLPESGMEHVRLALYRPFNKQWLYFDKNLNEKQYQLPKIFPDKDAQNVVINTGVGNGKDFSALVSDFISDYSLISPNQAYPLYYYDDFGNRHYAISGYALNLFRRHYGDNSIAEEEIFYYIYAIFHHKGYLEKYKNSLAKEAPRIALSEDFKELSMLGKELAELHLNYESGEMHTSVKYTTLMNAEVEGYYDVDKNDQKRGSHHL